MVEHDGLMRVFWPTDIRKSDRPGVVVGWRNSILDVFVVAILEDVDVSLCMLQDNSRDVLTGNRHETLNPTSRPVLSSAASSTRPTRLPICAAMDRCMSLASRMSQTRLQQTLPGFAQQQTQIPESRRSHAPKL